eukprot:TRINITY_DN78193_c0_g1_i1.p1 TRINITY_DN78193_c0_g1~~TRINITY_DN78193_c0_g1_i1.p1  ORF type:complete len:281 (-),score=30.20 TRINITY_DN78193_c0_g1_i1:129-971(-)
MGDATVNPTSSAVDLGTVKESPSFVRDVRKIVVGSLRANACPALFSLAVGLTTVAIYYGGGESTRPAFEYVSNLARDFDMAFSMAASSLCGGILPSLFLLARRQVPSPVIKNVAFNSILWFVLGAVVNILYKGQAVIFGEETNFSTVAKKVVFDQFVFNPVIVPLMSLVFRWRDCRFRLGWISFLEVTKPRSWFMSYCAFLLTTWCTWLPGTSVVYSFPTVLQLPAFNVILFFFSILLGFVSQRVSANSNEGEASPNGGEVIGRDKDPENDVAPHSAVWV